MAYSRPDRVRQSFCLTIRACDVRALFDCKSERPTEIRMRFVSWCAVMYDALACVCNVVILHAYAAHAHDSNVFVCSAGIAGRRTIGADRRFFGGQTDRTA